MEMKWESERQKYEMRSSTGKARCYVGVGSGGRLRLRQWRIRSGTQPHVILLIR